MTQSERITGIVLATLLLLATVNSTYYFLGMAKVSIVQWLVFNACAPSNIAYLAGLLIFQFNKNKMWLSIAVVPIFFFGTMGLFVFPWATANDIIVQASHIIMTLNMLWALWIVLKAHDYRALGQGLLVSIAVFIPFITFTQAYCREHAEDVMKILGI